MSAAKSGDTVRIHYTGKLEDGTQFDSSEGRDPLEFALGGGQVIPGFDSAVEGMTVGDTKSVTIQPEEAYGPRHDQLMQQVPRDQLPDDLSPEVGMALQSQSPDASNRSTAAMASSNQSPMAPSVNVPSLCPWPE